RGWNGQRSRESRPGRSADSGTVDAKSRTPKTDGAGAGRSFGGGKNGFCDAPLGRLRDRRNRGSLEIQFERGEKHCLSSGPEIAPRLAEKPDRWWQVWFEPRRLAAAGGIVALIIAAFVVGRVTKRVGPADNVANREQVRERVLVVAVGEHLGHSERMLIELSNEAPDDPKQKEVDISAEQRRAEDLLQENRLYRQTALREGDAGLANVLDELERVLLDVAHSPGEVTPAQLEA